MTFCLRETVRPFVFAVFLLLAVFFPGVARAAHDVTVFTSITRNSGTLSGIFPIGGLSSLYPNTVTYIYPDSSFHGEYYGNAYSTGCTTSVNLGSARMLVDGSLFGSSQSLASGGLSITSNPYPYSNAQHTAVLQASIPSLSPCVGIPWTTISSIPFKTLRNNATYLSVKELNGSGVEGAAFTSLGQGQTKRIRVHMRNTGNAQFLAGWGDGGYVLEAVDGGPFFPLLFPDYTTAGPVAPVSNFGTVPTAPPYDSAIPTNGDAWFDFNITAPLSQPVGNTSFRVQMNWWNAGGRFGPLVTIPVVITPPVTSPTGLQVLHTSTYDIRLNANLPQDCGPIKLSWDDTMVGITEYRLYRDSNPTPIYRGLTPSYTDASAMVSGSNHTYRVSAYFGAPFNSETPQSTGVSTRYTECLVVNGCTISSPLVQASNPFPVSSYNAGLKSYFVGDTVTLTPNLSGGAPNDGTYNTDTLWYRLFFLPGGCNPSTCPPIYETTGRPVTISIVPGTFNGGYEGTYPGIRYNSFYIRGIVNDIQSGLPGTTVQDTGPGVVTGCTILGVVPKNSFFIERYDEYLNLIPETSSTKTWYADFTPVSLTSIPFTNSVSLNPYGQRTDKAGGNFFIGVTAQSGYVVQTDTCEYPLGGEPQGLECFASFPALLTSNTSAFTTSGGVSGFGVQSPNLPVGITRKVVFRYVPNSGEVIALFANSGTFPAGIQGRINSSPSLTQNPQPDGSVRWNISPPLTGQTLQVKDIPGYTARYDFCTYDRYFNPTGPIGCTGSGTYTAMNCGGGWCTTPAFDIRPGTARQFFVGYTVATLPITITRVGVSGTVASAPAGTRTGVDSSTSLIANNPYTTSVAALPHTLYVTDASGFTERVGACYSAGCSVTTYPFTPTCNGTVCSYATPALSVSDQPKFVFQYTPNPLNISISSSKASVSSGETFTLTWSAPGATSCTVSGGSYSWTGTSGTQNNLTIPAATTFTANCTGASGAGSQSVTVGFNGGNIRATFVTDTVASGFPESAPAGVEAKLNSGLWVTANALSGIADFNGIPSGAHTLLIHDFPNYRETWASCTYLIGGTECVNSNPGNYVAIPTCDGTQCSLSLSVTNQTVTKVTLRYVPLPRAFITAPSSAFAGGQITVVWSSAEATTCTRSGDWTSSNNALSGSDVVTIPASGVLSKTFTIECQGLDGLSSGPVTRVVPVGSAPTGSLILTANGSSGPVTVSLGSRARLDWASNSAIQDNSCTRSGGTSLWPLSSGGSRNGTFVTSSILSPVSFTITCLDQTSVSVIQTVEIKVRKDDFKEI